ncbi:hypothetical protein FACS1894105_10070 [Clostridia bacterium]|nr:hypothetical protein FACS1894105_10070 [Clostridia bacterium]
MKKETKELLTHLRPILIIGSVQTVALFITMFTMQQLLFKILFCLQFISCVIFSILDAKQFKKRKKLQAVKIDSDTQI